jgi:hypothetical protein
VRFDCLFKKIFSPVSFTTVSGASLGENFLLMTLIAEHFLIMPSLPFFVTVSHYSFDRYDPVITADRIILAKKIRTPIRIVPMSWYPGPENYVPFSGNYLS